MHPGQFLHSRLVLRILPPDESNSAIKLGNKFGADAKESFRLVRIVKDLGLKLVGVR
jgi:hypothetical protein